MIKDTGRWICWKCHAQNPYGFSGSRPEFILNQILGQSVQDIQSLLYGEDGIVYKELDTGKESIFDEDQTEVEIQTELKEITLPFNFYTLAEPESELGRQYLKKRGIPLALAFNLDIRYCPHSERVVFPIKMNGKCYGYQARTILPLSKRDICPKCGNNLEVSAFIGLFDLDEIPNETQRLYNICDKCQTKSVPEKIKSMNSTGFKKERALMFFDTIKGDSVVLCEGPFDAMKHYLFGSFVSSMGQIVSPRQIELLQSKGIKKLYLGFDDDAVASAEKLAQNCPFDVYFIQPPDLARNRLNAIGVKKIDFGECTAEECLESIDRATELDGTKLFINF